VFFDNFFTSYNLLVSLREQQIKATGTVRENRLRNCPLVDTEAMKREERGVFDVKCDKQVMAVKWHDNQCVTVASNYDSVQPVGTAKRWSSSKKALTDLPQPAVVGSYNAHMGGVDIYNAHMGGVDILDRFMANYRPAFRSKKWWWPLFLNGICMAAVAAWRLHVELGGSFDQLAFRRYLVRTLLQRSDKPRAVLSGPSSKPVDDVRYDGMQHHLVQNDKHRQDADCVTRMHT
jgi:hypothetical protein